MAKKDKKPPHDRLGSIEEVLEPAMKSSPIAEIEVDKLQPYPKHLFRLYEGARLVDLIDSIKKDGVIQPVIVRKMENAELQILSGHNRVNAAKEAGLSAVPARVLEDIDDATAERIVYTTNLMQRSISEIAPSEAAAIVAKVHRSLFSQGRRTDIQRQMEVLEKDDKERYSTNALLKERYDLSASKIAQYLRIDRLLEDIKPYLDEGRIPFTAAADLSFLPAEYQCLLTELLHDNPVLHISITNAMYFKTLHKAGKLTSELINRILLGADDEDEKLSSDEESERPPRSIKAKPSGVSVYLPPELVEDGFGCWKKRQIREWVVALVAKNLPEKG